MEKKRTKKRIIFIFRTHIYKKKKLIKCIIYLRGTRGEIRSLKECFSIKKIVVYLIKHSFRSKQKCV